MTPWELSPEGQRWLESWRPQKECIVEIKSNEELFNKWKRLAAKVQNINAIVQNDVDIPKEEIREWMKSAHSVKDEMQALIQETEKYCLKNSNGVE